MIRRSFHAAVLAFSIAAATGLAAGTAHAMDDLRIIAPAKPGGGWDQTARSLAEVMAAGGAKGVTVENVPGAGGTVGLAQLIDQEKGKPNVLMVHGLVMIGAILTNQSPVNLSMTTPIARLTGEYEVIVVPAASEIKTLADLAAKIKADAGSVAIGGGSAGGTDHILAGLVVKSAGGDVTKLNYVPFSGGGEALDVTVQAQILDLLRDLQQETGMSIILITHDLGVVAEMADEVAVMYAGRVAERASAKDLFGGPQHPYTLGLLGSVPRLDEDRDRLLAIEGAVPPPFALPKGCRFNPRCPFMIEACTAAQPPLEEIEPGHFAACIRAPVENAVDLAA